MKAILVTSLILLSSTYSFADTRVGKEFCSKFTKQSVVTGFDFRSVASKNIRAFYGEFSYNNDEVLAYIKKVGNQTAASMNKLCASKGDNVTIEDMSNVLNFECPQACAQGGDKDAFKKSLIDTQYNHNLKVGRYLDYCNELCDAPDSELNNIKKGIAIQAKNQSPDCTDVVIDSSRTKFKSITIDLDKINAEAKAKKASGK